MIFATIRELFVILLIRNEKKSFMHRVYIFRLSVWLLLLLPVYINILQPETAHLTDAIIDIFCTMVAINDGIQVISLTAGRFELTEKYLCFEGGNEEVRGIRLY